jgi:hypothetical protein
LLEKYQVKKNGNITDCGCFNVDDKEVVLLPWRVERRFVEFKNLTDNNTLEYVSTFRFAHRLRLTTKL